MMMEFSYETAIPKLRKPSALDLTEMRDIAARICRDYLTGAWKTISAEDLKLKKISGGLSNFLFYVSLPDENDSGPNSPRSVSSSTTTHCHKRSRKDSHRDMEPKEVLLRIYGQTHGEQALESMLTESVVFTLLSERRLGPKLHGIFPGGRIEQYIPARPLTTLELSDPKVTMKIAQKMAEIHSLDIPVSKEPDWLWSTMNRWIQNVDTILSNYEPSVGDNRVITDNEKKAEQIERFKKINFREEIKWLKKVVEQSKFPVVFSHNDLQEGNILLKETDSNLSLERFNTTQDDNLDDSALDAQINSILITPYSNKPDDNLNNSYLMAHDNNNGINRNLCQKKSSRKRSFEEGNGGNGCGGGSGEHDNSIHHQHNHQTTSVRSSNEKNSNDILDLDNTRDSVISSETFSNDENGDPDLIIIDYEYCAYNYRGFDLANHFIEWTFDYTHEAEPHFTYKTEQYPSNEQMQTFIATYLKQLHFCTEKNDDYVLDSNEITSILREIKCFTLASHLFWSLWSLVNVQSEIQFGYTEYAATRIGEYFNAKEQYIRNVQNKLKQKK